MSLIVSPRLLFISLLLPLLLISSCKDDDVESCTPEFLADYDRAQNLFRDVYQENGNREDYLLLKQHLESFLESYEDVKCERDGVTLKPTKEIESFLELNDESLLFRDFEKISKVVYGEDNRVDVEDSTVQRYRHWSRSVAVQMGEEKVFEDWSLLNTTLKQQENLCDGERFEDQLVPGNCSGFLVRQDVLVTAGHCVVSDWDCAHNYWVFDFVKGVNVLNPDNVYTCKEIIERKQTLNGTDYAVIKLDRPVSDRLPVPFRDGGKIKNDANLVVIGHPSGLPAKITDQGKVRDNSDSIFFVTNLDTFAGNSGSPVFNADTGIVEGILVRGETDYITVTLPDGSRCRKVNVCGEDECGGEEVTRMTLVGGIPEDELPSRDMVFTGIFEKKDFELDRMSGRISFYSYQYNGKTISGLGFLGLCGLHFYENVNPAEWLAHDIVSCDSKELLDPVFSEFLLYE